VFERLHLPLEHLRMPSLDGAVEWLNSEPLSPAELPGRQHALARVTRLRPRHGAARIRLERLG
jgi:hypothetical protein